MLISFFFLAQAVVLQHRPCNTDKECTLWRHWNSSVADSFEAAIRVHYPKYKVNMYALKQTCYVTLYSIS